MSDDTDVNPEQAHHTARMRLPRRILVFGPAVAFVLAFLLSMTGTDGRAGAFMFLLLLAVVFGAAGVTVAGQLLYDEFTDRPTSGRRVVTAGVLFAATLVCMTAIGGLAGGSAG